MLIKNARIVLRHEVVTGTLSIRDGVVDQINPGTTGATAAIDWNGDYLLPGLVELHTDNLEKHLLPREGVIWNVGAALVAHDAQIAAAGITTVFDAITIGSHPTHATQDSAVALDSANALLRLSQRNVLRVSHLLHLRCELPTPNVVTTFDRLQAHPLLRLCSVMDHTPGQGQWQDLTNWRRSRERNGRLSDDSFATMVSTLNTLKDRFAARNRDQIIARCKALSVALASHDDASAQQIAEAKAEGIGLAEFPTTREAAAAARKLGIGTVLGAPNLVRGASHAGNVSVRELVEADLVDALSSDYFPSSLLTAAFTLAEQGGWTLPRAISAMSATPALLVGLNDRGAIEPGLRADFSRVVTMNRLPLVRETFVAGTRVI
ncbi:alpha-D-ribose 1-methylphosphonate 5-triphosphate diphosphatase [Caballeronia sp. AZ7_KS35]|uniref:alpha-D-ribose 1-methylphosphonate 5-triphosphate diphosphatase n=1 Tax=Caballeronia sp. AZ7_KS35 TaxID=2921762 RepID=UPI0020286D25|nr:alpha-D-ribose 1-methylphosphonate 5-triphosphate diphosphatase [Caballeronia sp. AZ7_KS35]